NERPQWLNRLQKNSSFPESVDFGGNLGYSKLSKNSYKSLVAPPVASTVYSLSEIVSFSAACKAVSISRHLSARRPRTKVLGYEPRPFKAKSPCTTTASRFYFAVS